MTSARKDSLENVTFSGLNPSLDQFISDGFKSSTLPEAGSQNSQLPEKRSDNVNLYELVQTDGTNAAIHGNLHRVKEIVLDLQKCSRPQLIDVASQANGYNMLHFAVCYKRQPIVKFLIDNGADIEYTTKDGEENTPLMLAIRYYNTHMDTPLKLAVRYYDNFKDKSMDDASTLKRGETSANIVRLLLQHEAIINTQNAAGITPLILAVQMQNESITKQLLESPGILPDKQNFQGYSPLHYACAEQNTNIIALLLNNGADMFSKTDKGYIPFHIACQRGNVEAIEALIQKCSEEDTSEANCRDKLFKAEDNLGNTAILFAKEAPDTTAFNLLLTKYNIDIHSKNHIGDGIFHKFTKDDNGLLNADLLETHEYMGMLKEGNSKKETPLHTACQMGYFKNIALFIQKGAEYSTSNAAGNTPLMTAIIGGNIDVLLHMLKAINDHENMSFRDILSLNVKNNKTILTWAIENNHTVLIKAIMQLDAHLATEVYPDNGKALIHMAAAAGALSTVEILCLFDKRLKLGLLLLPDNNGRTPLMLAAQNGHLDCVEALNSSGAKVDNTDGITGDESGFNALNITDNDEHTALHLACNNGHFHIVSYLCTHDADLEACAGEDGTPLTCAANKGHVNILNYLLGQNANVNGDTKSKSSPLMLASKSGHEKCVKLLLQQPHVNVTIQDEDGHNCLALAAISKHLQTSLAIINSPYWKDALKGCDKDLATPLRLLIKYLPDAAEVILFRCINHIKNDKGEDVTIEMCFEFLDDFEDPVKGGISALVNRYFGDHAYSVTEDETELLEDPTRVEPVGLQMFKSNNHVLQWMVRHERTRLLQHPVTRELVSYKWKAYAMPAFLINLAIYLTFLAFLTGFALALPLPTESVCMGDVDDNNCSDDNTQVFLRFAGTVLLIFCSVRALVELLQLIRRRKAYLTEAENYLELLLICSTITFATAGQAEACFCLEDFSWAFGALAVFLAWIDLVLHLKKLPLTAIPINMLQSIVMTFLKLLYLPVILIVAFAIPFYMLLSRPEHENPFDTPGYSLLKSFAMTAGEFTYDNVFLFQDDAATLTMTDPPELNYFTMSCILWVIFIILMPVLFANLLVGLAVGDIQKVEEKAKLTYLSLLVDLALEMEGNLPWIRRKLKKTSHRVEKYPKLPWYLLWYHKLVNTIFRNTFEELESKISALKSEDKLSSLLQGLEVLEPIDDIKVQVQINTVTMKQIKDALTKESVETTELNAKIETILKVIEDLRQDVMKIAADDHRSRPKIPPPKFTTNRGFRAKTEESPTSYIM